MNKSFHATMRANGLQVIVGHESGKYLSAIVDIEESNITERLDGENGVYTVTYVNSSRTIYTGDTKKEVADKAKSKNKNKERNKK